MSLHSVQEIIRLELTTNTFRSTLRINKDAEGLALWFSLHFDDKLILSTGPGATPTHWKQTLLGACLPVGHHEIIVEPDPADSRGLRCRFDLEANSSTAHINGNLGDYSIR